jgi:hypothetical protein
MEMKMDSIKRNARIAGLFYFLFIACSILADQFARIGFGDPAAIFDKIVAHDGQFRMGFVLGLLSALFFLLAAWALYVLLKPVHENFALLFLLLNLAGVAVQCFSMLPLLGAQLLFSGAASLKVFPAEQLQALVMFLINLFKNGFMIAQLFYGTWLLPLGYLVFKSGFLPRILGILLIIDFFGVLIWFFQFFLLPAYPLVSYPGLVASAIAEFSLTLWLLIMGVKVQKPVIKTS